MKRAIDKYQVSLKVVFRDGDKMLALAKDKGSFAGLYDFPGGRVDVVEFETDFMEILAREISEEIGDVEYELERRPVGMGRHRIAADGEAPEIHVLYVLHEAQWKSGTVKISEEHSGYKWLDVEEVRKAPERFFKSGNLEAVKTYLGVR